MDNSTDDQVASAGVLMADGAVAIPADIAAKVREIGRAEWGQTPAHDADGHAAHVAESVSKTADHFGQDGPQHMQGLYIEGTETVICHTGTSPNSAQIARALTGAWNWLYDQATTPTPSEEPEKAATGEDDELLADANAWYSDTQVAEIKRYASHPRDCLSRKGAHYDDRDCDCGFVRDVEQAEPVTRDRIIAALAALSDNLAKGGA